MVSVVSTTGTTSTTITSDSSSSSSSPSTSSTTSGSNRLTLSGLASGMDTASIVSQLMKVESIPRDQVYQKQQWVEWQQDAYRSINTALSTFQSAEQNLRFQSSFSPYKVTSGDQNDVTATAGSNVLQGTYQVTVNQTATAATLISQNKIVNSTTNAGAQSSDPIGMGGTFYIQPPIPAGGSKPATVAITVNATDNYQSIVNQINNAGIGLKASFDNSTSRFVINSTTTGSSQNYTFTDTATDGTQSTTANPLINLLVNGNDPNATITPVSSPYSFSGKDANVTIQPPGGSAINNITSSTNNISALGLNLTLINSTSGSVNINVQTDTDTVYNNIKGFVDAYNTLMDTINTKLTEKRNYDYPPLTQDQRNAMNDNQISLWEAKAKSGVLEHDSTLQGIADQLRNAINTPVQSISSGSIRTLSSIGVGTEFVKSNGSLVTDDNNTGHLQIDETTLRAAIANNPDQVMSLFTVADPLATGTTKARTDYEGIGQRLYDIASNSISQLVTVAGLPGGSYNDGSNLGDQVKDLSQQLSDWADRLSAMQTRYNNQFTAMETMMNKFNSQSAYVSQMLG